MTTHIYPPNNNMKSVFTNHNGHLHTNKNSPCKKGQKWVENVKTTLEVDLKCYKKVKYDISVKLYFRVS